jgi:hypothetical protein
MSTSIWAAAGETAMAPPSTAATISNRAFKRITFLSATSSRSKPVLR